MNLIKAFLVAVLFVFAVSLTVQNVDVLSISMRFGLDWPASLAFSGELPVYAVIMGLFLIGFVLVALVALLENRAGRRQVRGLYAQIQALERELQPEVASAAQAETSAKGESQTHFQTKTEQTAMGSSTTPCVDESASHRAKTGDEVLVKPSAPGWGAVLLLSAALALVVGGAVYILLSERLKPVAAQLDELSGLAGQLRSAQEEMDRSWEQERVAMRQEIKAVGTSQAALLDEVGRLKNQMQVLSKLPEEVRKRIVAGFLRETAGRVAYLGSQVDGMEQQEALREIRELLQALALELEGGASQISGEE